MALTKSYPGRSSVFISYLFDHSQHNMCRTSSGRRRPKRPAILFCLVMNKLYRRKSIFHSLQIPSKNMLCLLWNDIWVTCERLACCLFAHCTMHTQSHSAYQAVVVGRACGLSNCTGTGLAAVPIKLSQDGLACAFRWRRRRLHFKARSLLEVSLGTPLLLWTPNSLDLSQDCLNTLKSSDPATAVGCDKYRTDGSLGSTYAT